MGSFHSLIGRYTSVRLLLLLLLPGNGKYNTLLLVMLYFCIEY